MLKVTQKTRQLMGLKADTRERIVNDAYYDFEEAIAKTFNELFKKLGELDVGIKDSEEYIDTIKEFRDMRTQVIDTYGMSDKLEALQILVAEYDS